MHFYGVAMITYFVRDGSGFRVWYSIEVSDPRSIEPLLLEHLKNNYSSCKVESLFTKYQTLEITFADPADEAAFTLASANGLNL